MGFCWPSKVQAASTDTKHERRLKAGLAWAACGPRDAQEMELKMMHLERFRLAVQKRPKTFEAEQTVSLKEFAS